MAASRQIAIATAHWWQELAQPPEILGIGIDRIDYTKGIPERLKAIDRLLEEHPEYIGRLVFLQVGVPSRTAIADYDSLNQELVCAGGRDQPEVGARALEAGHSDTAPGRSAGTGSTSSDGRLLSGQFASRWNESGGERVRRQPHRWRRRSDSQCIHRCCARIDRCSDSKPFRVDEMAAAMHEAIKMPGAVRRRRMSRMRSVVAANNVYTWAGKILLTLSGIAVCNTAAGKPEAAEALAVAQAAR